MKRLQNLVLLIAIFLHLNVTAQTSFTDQFNGTGNFPSTTTSYLFNIINAYPSPLLTSEMAPPSPSLRGLDASYSVIVGGDYIIPAGGGSESEGRVAVGGNFLNAKGEHYGIAQSGGGTFVVGKGDAAFEDGYSIYALAIAGNLQINNTTTLSIGANNDPHPYTVGVGGTLTNNGKLSVTNIVTGGNYIPVDITGIINQMTALSLSMSNAQPSATVNIGTTNFLPTYVPAIFTGSGTKDIEVFNITATDLALATFINPIEFAKIKAGATIIINVSGTNISGTNYVAQAGRINDPNNGTSDDNALVYNLVWNFYEATNISTSASADINGMIIAPFANLTVNSNINGRVYIGGNLIHKGPGTEIHNFPFLGDLSRFSESVLPVELIYFKASLNQCKVSLVWATASELNNDFFEVQRSNDLSNWESIGSVDGNGNSNIRVEYQFDDNNIHSGITYYRLKQVDFDGVIEYHKIISIDGTKCSTDAVKIFPVPARNTISIENIESYTSIHIYNTAGILVKVQDLTGQNRNEINVSNLPKGSYYFELRDNKNTKTILKGIIQ